MRLLWTSKGEQIFVLRLFSYLQKQGFWRWDLWLQHLLHQIQGLHKAIFTRESVFHFFDWIQDLFVVITIEWGNCAQEDIKDDSQTPDVTFFVVVCFHNLRSKIVGLNNEGVTVPTSFFSPLFLSYSLKFFYHLTASPKSMSLRLVESFLKKRKFSGLRSRWAIWFLWR